MAIYEDYPNWKANDLKRDFAKLLLIDQADYNTHHIFFDDNADEEDDCIVDVRDVVTSERIPYQKFMDLYVVKVHPHRAILEPEYFIKMIEQVEENRSEEIARIEEGIDEERKSSVMEDTENTEWEKLQKMNNSEYLMKTVLPVLYQGMRVVDLERPAAPLEYLSLYLLKNQDKIKLPPKAYSKNDQ
mmetsp:Transcript_4984/g.3425  ORF Transcript_4984/g.3425 Transcript_4984/m.3425 type:complete len:187 (-) Transcript_4984:90-650(-)